MIGNTPSFSWMLLTDLYQLTMAYGYWKRKLTQREAVFHLFFRRAPFKGGFTVAAGLESVVHFLENFRFSSSDLTYLSSLKGQEGTPLFEPAFLDYLSSLEFTGDVDAVAEGSVVFPYEPLFRVQGPLIVCQLLETPLLNLVNFPTLIATKAARVCLAARGDPVLEFGMRRAQGVDGALTASRAAYIGGCSSTSNVLAGKLYHIPVRGTHSHSWVMVFDDELEAFQEYAAALPSECIFLVDTYNSLEGVKKAIVVGRSLKEQGHTLKGIRLDSGDLADLSMKSRQLLDEAGFSDALIVASNELDETVIGELKRQGARVDVWGVGTHLVTGDGQSALDGVYKLSAVRDPGGPWKDRIKLSEQMLKVSNPGILQVRRYFTPDANVADVLYDTRGPLSPNMSTQDAIDPLDPTREWVIKKDLPFHDLLQPIFRSGKKVYSLPPLVTIQAHAKQELAHFSIGIKRFLNPHSYFVGMEKSLYRRKVALIKQMRQTKKQI